jgi:hypothetical protein
MPATPRGRREGELEVNNRYCQITIALQFASSGHNSLLSGISSAATGYVALHLTSALSR